MGIDIKYLQRIVDEVLKTSALKDITWSTLALVLTREIRGLQTLVLLPRRWFSHAILRQL